MADITTEAPVRRISNAYQNWYRFSRNPTAVIGALIIQTLSVTIILSGIPPKFNLLIKASAIILVLLMQSPRFQQQLSQLNFWSSLFKKGKKEINRA